MITLVPSHHECRRHLVADLVDRDARSVHREAQDGREEAVEDATIEAAVDPDPRTDQEVNLGSIL
jgi:hypothetical protein